VGQSNKAMLFLIACPVGPYYKTTGFDAVSLHAETELVRAWPGGTGAYKLGANYAGGILPQLRVAAEGYQQNLWLFGPEHELTEVGTMNCFVYWQNGHGRTQLITPPLDGTILPGVTRDSVLQLARRWNEFEVVEGPIRMGEVVRALSDGRLLEMFGTGTASLVAPIKRIRYEGVDYRIPLDPRDDKAQAGPLATRLWTTLTRIQYGEEQFDDWSVLVV
jgi:branched-chain amino acid aminotransferase